MFSREAMVQLRTNGSQYQRCIASQLGEIEHGVGRVVE